MINHVKIKVGREIHKLKFSTAALMRMEEENDGKPFDALVDHLISGKGGASFVVAVLAAVMNEGAGGTREEAADLADAVGGVRRVLMHLGEAMAVAFPAEADPDADPEGGTEGNDEGNTGGNVAAAGA